MGLASVRWISAYKCAVRRVTVGRRSVGSSTWWTIRDPSILAVAMSCSTRLMLGK